MEASRNAPNEFIDLVSKVILKLWNFTRNIGKGLMIIFLKDAAQVSNAGLRYYASLEQCKSATLSGYQCFVSSIVLGT